MDDDDGATTTAGPASEPATVHVDVDRFIWKYVNKSATYRDRIRAAIDTEREVSVAESDVDGDDCAKQVLQLSAGSEELAAAARTALLQLVDECRQTVSTYTVRGQTADTCDAVTENFSTFDDPESAMVDVDSAGGLLRLTGTKNEIKHTKGLLEILGIPVDDAPEDERPPARTTEPSTDEAAPPSLQLWKEHQEDEHVEEEVIYAPERSDDSPSTVVVDAKLWKYLQKSKWAAEIRDVRERTGIVMTESLTDDGEVSLAFAGSEEDIIVEATDRMRRLVDRSRDAAVRTVDVVCPDSAVRSKVLKFLPHINKSSTYMAVESDERLTATGTSDELDECSSKLTKLGASLARGSDDAGDRPRPSSKDASNTARDNEPAPYTPWPELDGGSSVVKPDLEEDERMARQLQEEEDAGSSGGRGHFVPARVSADNGEDGRPYAEIPVPIEDVLWSFVDKRRAAQLQQLREAYRAKITAYPAAQEGFVVIAIEAESALMVECAQDELIQLLENLRGSIVVQVLQAGDEDGDRGRQLPPQVGQLFSQLAEGTDAIIEVKSNNITITGPEKAVAECQQKIAAFVQQVQQEGGMGGGGGVGRGMSLGGRGRGGAGMGLPSGMSDAEMARYMRNQTMQMPGSRGSADDMMRAMMGGGGSRAGGPGEYGDFFGMPRGGAGSFAPFARNPPNAMNMETGPDRGGGGGGRGGMWPPERRPTGGLDSFGIGDPMTQGMFATGDRDADLRSYDRSSGGYLMASSGHVPSKQPTSQQQQERSADGSSFSCEPKPRVVRFADETPATQPKAPPVATTNAHDHDLPEAKECSVCQHTERGGEADKTCRHAFCVSCVQQYFGDDQHHCPVCGSDDDQRQQQQAPATGTQPDDGVMIVTYDNAFRLPGCEATSRGTIVVLYSFPPGVQKAFQPNPGRRYNGISKTAFFPLSTEGSRIVDLLQRAFDSRQLFAMVPTLDGKSEEITWNGFHHKTNIYGGPKKFGYPDPVYLKRIQHELQSKGFH